MRFQIASCITKAIIHGGKLDKLIKPVAPNLALTGECAYMTTDVYFNTLYNLSKIFKHIFVVSPYKYDLPHLPNVHILHNSEIIVDDVCIIGGRLFTYFENPDKNYSDKIFFENSIVASAISATNNKVKSYSSTVVITDTAPSISLVPSWIPDSMKPKLAVNMEPCIPYANAWIFGCEKYQTSSSGVFKKTLCISNIANGDGYLPECYVDVIEHQQLK